MQEVPSSGVNVQFNCGGGGTLMANVATQRLIPALSPEKEKRKEREEGGQDSEEKDQQQHCSSAAEEEEATGAERGGLLLLQKEEEDEESFNQMLKELKPSKKSWASKLAKARLKLSCVGRFSTLFEVYAPLHFQPLHLPVQTLPHAFKCFFLMEFAAKQMHIRSKARVG